MLLLLIAIARCDSPEKKRDAQVRTLGVEEITDYSALCVGEIVDEGSGTIAHSGIELNDGKGYVKYPRTISAGKKFAVKFTNLSPETTYKYRAYVDDGTVQYGAEKQLTTLSAVRSKAVIDPITITGNSVIVSCFDVPDKYKRWGIYYGTDVSPSSSKKEASMKDIVIEGFKPNTTYHLLPYFIVGSKEIFMDELSFTTLDPAQPLKPNVHNMHPVEQLRFVKYRVARKDEPYYTAYRTLIADADEFLRSDAVNHAVANFNVPGYYSNPEGHKAAAATIAGDSYAAYSTALAYRLSGEQKYGKKSVYYLNAWAEKNTKCSGADGALTMTRAGGGLVTAAELMTDTPLWSDSERNSFATWVQNIYQRAGNGIRNRKNNWADWGRYASILSASFLSDFDEANENIRLIKSDLFLKIAPDGHMPEEVTRNADGTWYTYFSLSPMTAACWIAYNMTGENIFEMVSPEGASIEKAINYLLYYIKNPGEWPWYHKNTAGHPHSWPGNLVEAMHGIYKNPDYTGYVAGSRPIIYKDHHFTWTFPTLMPLSLTGY